MSSIVCGAIVIIRLTGACSPAAPDPLPLIAKVRRDWGRLKNDIDLPGRYTRKLGLPPFMGLLLFAHPRVSLGGRTAIVSMSVRRAS